MFSPVKFIAKSSEKTEIKWTRCSSAGCSFIDTALATCFAEQKQEEKMEFTKAKNNLNLIGTDSQNYSKGNQDIRNIELMASSYSEDASRF